jgi:hypothetical protein
MGDGLWITGPDAGCRFFTITRLARGARIPDLLSFVVFDKGDRFLPEDVNLIGTDFEGLPWTDFHALPAAVTFIRIDGDIPVTRPVFKTVVSYHILPWFEVRGWRS